MTTTQEKPPTTVEEPETEEKPDDPDAEEEAEAEEGADPNEPLAEPEPESSAKKGKTPQEQFQAAFAAFVKKAAACFEIPPSEVQVAPHPGVVGIMLPGFAEPRLHQDFTTCTTCNGLGKVLTGAITGDPGKDFHTCPDTRCKGNGYWQKQSAMTPQPTTGPLAVGTPAPSGDEWGEAPAWMGDPSLGPGR